MEETALNSATRQQVPSQFLFVEHSSAGRSIMASVSRLFTSIFKESAHEGELLRIQSRHCFVLFRCHWCAPCESAGNLRSPGEIEKCVLSVLSWWSALGQGTPVTPTMFPRTPRRCREAASKKNAEPGKKLSPIARPRRLAPNQAAGTV